MHILHITPYYAPAYAFGGVTRSVEGMTVALTKQGHRVTVLTTDALSQTERFTGPQQEIHQGVQVIRVRNLSAWLRGKFNLSTPLQMGGAAAHLLHDVDIIHCHEFRTTENLMVIPQAARHSIPVLLSPHGTLSQQTGRSTVKTLWDKLISPTIAPKISGIIGLTADEARDAQTLWNGFGLQPRYHVVPNGISIDEFAALPDSATFRDKYNLGRDGVLLFMGRLHPRKGADLLAKAFQQANVPNSRLLIVGPDEGLKPKLSQLAQDDQRIVLTDYLGGTDRLAALAAADVFALPAIGEGLPMSVLEAMAAGLPVIVSPECHLPEVAAHGAGFEVEVDQNALAAKIHLLLTDAAMRSQMSEAALKLVHERFTWDKVAQQLQAIYQSYR